MDFIPRASLNKIPGSLAPPALKEKHTKDLSKLTRMELDEIYEREKHLLSNKKRLERLPDKGKRVREYIDKVLAEIERRDNIDEAAALFSELNIASKAQNALNNLEWNGRLNILDNPNEDVLDSDDETEMDPLRVVAQHTMHEKRIKVQAETKALITEQDLAEIATFQADSPDSGLAITGESSSDTNSSITARTPSESADGKTIDAELFGNDTSDKIKNIKPQCKKTVGNTKLVEDEDDIDQHVRYLVEKTESQKGTPQREKFKPYKTTITNVHDPAKERIRKQGKHWEITAATPPLIQHNEAQLLSLMDSVDIQTKYLTKMKELQEKQAVERLALQKKRLELRKLELPEQSTLKTGKAFTAYRDNVIEGNLQFNENDDVPDHENEKSDVGVTYTVYE